MSDLVTVLLMLACAGVMAAAVKFLGDDEFERQWHEAELKRKRGV